MAKVIQIIKKIEEFAPLETMQEWDNSGWQINLGIKETNKILLALDVTENTIDEAIEKHCDLIISHHPVFFTSIKSISAPFIIKAIQNNIQIYSAHTNLDIAKGGVSDILAKKCGFEDTDEIYQFIRLKKLKQPKDFLELTDKIKHVFGVEFLKVINPERKTYKSIAFCSGSGAEFIDKLEKLGIDVYITGDVKHHSALDANKVSVIDLGHFQTEKFALEIFENILQNENAQIIKSEEKQPWEYL